jgi:16S rRNA (cytidine1402-2'-O)-methyltransferase
MPEQFPAPEAPKRAYSIGTRGTIELLTTPQVRRQGPTSVALVPARSRAASVSFRGRGHGGITGTHDKTLEFTRDAVVTKRATCVLAVESDHDDQALLPLRGDVRVTLSCGEYRDTFEASMTPFFLGDDSLVVRRGPPLRARTLAGHASKSAAEVDRALVRAMANPESVLEVTITELGRGDRRGALFAVAVPIGNDDDLSPRARRVLEATDVVLAEDTRRLRDLAQRTAMHLHGDVVSYHEHNERERAHEALARLEAGARVALVTDAGTPLFSDPGYVIVREAIDAGIDVSPIPGPSSLLATLSVAGLPMDRFVYVGFLPRRATARQTELRRLREHSVTFVVHEAPHRVAALLQDCAEVLPDWECCIGREITKIFEEFQRGTAAELAAAVTDQEARGEYTFVIAPPKSAAPAAEPDDERLDLLVGALLAQGVTPKTIAHALAELPGTSRKEAYARVLAIAERS